ncbi:hypothetical protein ABZ725_28545 [Streptomyces sp. NPDC006872]|uniref:hypothetical protein n=1 Tax=Streptomyces sp. NPDC006872 TaxID=3155720 RepID=UPI003407969B
MGALGTDTMVAVGTGRTVAVELDETACECLVRTAVSLKEQVRAVMRARIVLAAADGLSNGPSRGSRRFT